jgi:CBS domain containing-hemolysin-like protein
VCDWRSGSTVSQVGFGVPLRETLPMTGTDVLTLLALVALVLLAALLGAAEAALLRVPRVRIEVRASEGERSAERVLPLVDDLPRVLNTILLVVLLVQIAAATLAAALASRHFGNLGVTITSILLTVVLFVYAESIPKTFAVHHPARVAELTAAPVRLLVTLLRPIVSALVWFADLQVPGSGIATTSAVSEQELVRLAADAAEAGRIEPTDLDLIERAFALGDLQVGSIIVPRTEVVAVPAEATMAEALRVATKSGHRRLPVYEGDLDSVIGIVRLRDLATGAMTDPERPARTVSRRELLIPESRRVVDLLDDMQRTGMHFAVVVDEHGGTEGVVTIEDVVARLVGSIAETEDREPSVDAIGPRTWRVDGGFDISDLERIVGRELPDGDWTTVAGLVIGTVGRIPERGEVLEIGDVRFEVVDARPQQVVALEVTDIGPDG